MILNSFAVLDCFVTLLRFVLAVLLLFLAVPAWRAWRNGRNDDREGLENCAYLLSLLGFLLLFLNLASWPILYLLLDSYVPEWPGVMCIYGVTQVGTGSLGPARWLPDLLRVLQILKPIQVFVSGAWLILYLANRQTSRSPLMGRLFLILVGLGVLALADCGTEAAYLLIPKKDNLPETGCCMPLSENDARLMPSPILDERMRRWLSPAFYAANAMMILTLLWSVYGRSQSFTGPRLGLLLAGAGVTLAVSWTFLIDVGAPRLLGLPHHHCLYDLIPRAPASVLAIACFVGATFAVGWACVAAWLASCPETQPALQNQIRTILTLGLFAYAGFLVAISLELALT